MIELTDKEFAEKVQISIDRVAGYKGKQYAEMGYELIACGTENEKSPYIEYSYVAKPEHRNNYDGLFGGTICGVFDTCMGMGAVALTQHFVTTVDITVSFLREARGDEYVVRIDYPHVGGRIVNMNGTLTDKKTGEPVATAVSTFAVLDKEISGLRD